MMNTDNISDKTIQKGLPRREPELVAAAQACWNTWGNFRRQRQRCKRYTYGEQWDDIITVDGHSMTEKEYILSQGNLPLKNNLIRRLVRNVVGVWRNRYKKPAWPLPEPDPDRRRQLKNLLTESSNFNNLPEIFARSLEEFLISGLALLKKGVENRNGRLGSVTHIVQPDKFFLDPGTIDPRGWDISICGEIHDMDFKALCAAFADSAEDYSILKEIFLSEAAKRPGDGFERSFGDDNGGESNFLTPRSTSLCRVIEIWRRETVLRLICHDPIPGEIFKSNVEDIDVIKEINRQRVEESKPEIETSWSPDEIWRYYFVTASGHILASGDSPWNHNSHPYIFKAYPFIDGEIHSFVGDIIDQQRYTNRLISLYDWIMRASAKGVLLFPDGSLPDGVDIDDISDEWSKFNGVILYRPKANTPMPQQVSCNSTNIGITELLDIQMRLMEDISGVNGALQGNLANNNMSGTLFNQQTQNSLTAITDLLDSFDSFVADTLEMEAANILQSITS